MGKINDVLNILGFAKTISGNLVLIFFSLSIVSLIVWMFDDINIWWSLGFLITSLVIGSNSSEVQGNS